MQRTRLNLSALRGSHLPRPHQPDLTLTKLADSDSAVTLSRRELLGLAGAAAVSMQPLSKAVGAALLGRFELVGGRKRLAFKLGGRERWVIDTRSFSGSPVLRCYKAANRIHIELAGAKYPGTNLPADMVCELKRGIVGWRMKLKLGLGGFESEVPFERWLAGEEPARATVNVRASVCRLGSGPGLKLSGPAEAEFCPTWTLRLNGPAVATMSGRDTKIVSDSVTLSLLSSRNPSLMSQPAAKRTLITLERGKRAWRLEQTLSAPDDGKLVAADNAFDVICVEAGESSTGQVRQALVAQSAADKSQLSFQPGGSLAESDGESFRLPLRNARYAVAFDSTGNQTALMADFDKDPVWLRMDGCSVQVGDGTGSAPFELVSLNGKVKEMRCEPALLGIAAPLHGAIVDPAPAVEAARVQFVSGTTKVAQQPPVLRTPPRRGQQPPPREQPPTREQLPARQQPPTRQQPPAGQILIRPERIEALIPLVPFIVTVLRPEDLLVLRFQFVNFVLKTESGQPARLMRIKPDKPAYIIVHFPPQHIAEQAFLEQAPEVSGLEGAMEDDSPVPPPVESRLAGASRLAFRVPDDVSEIP